MTHLDKTTKGADGMGGGKPPQPPTDLFYKSFYNWLLLNGVDMYVKGSEMTSSIANSFILAEIDMEKLRDAILWEIKKPEVVRLARDVGAQRPTHKSEEEKV